jgi:hypothetical protein
MSYKNAIVLLGVIYTDYLSLWLILLAIKFGLGCAIGELHLHAFLEAALIQAVKYCE